LDSVRNEHPPCQIDGGWGKWKKVPEESNRADSLIQPKYYIFYNF